MSFEKLQAYSMGPTCEVDSLKEISVLRSFRAAQTCAGTAESRSQPSVREEGRSDSFPEGLRHQGCL